MTNQYEVASLINDQFPQLYNADACGHVDVSIYLSLNKLTAYTKATVHQHDFKHARQCFELVKHLYETGDKTVKNLIENIFVYSLDTILSDLGKENTIWQKLIPKNLYSVYLKQVMASGC